MTIHHTKWLSACLLLSCLTVCVAAETFDWMTMVNGIRDLLVKWTPKASQPDTTESEMIPELSNSTTYKPLLNTLSATRRVIKYFQDNYGVINLDAVACLRMAQDQFQVILKKFDNLSGIKSLSDDAKKAIRNDAMNFNTSLANICDKAIPLSEKSNKVYFDTIAPILRKNVWMLDYPTRITNASYLFSRDNLTAEFDEKRSDNCYSELIGTNEHAGLPCSPTDQCWKYQTNPNSSGYRLTHQVLYLQIAETNPDCLASVNRLTELNKQVSSSRLVDIYCANVLQDMKDAFNASTGVCVGNRDLFLEQAGLCGMMGFRDLFTLPWLEHILSWQKEEGCFGLLQQDIPDYMDYQKTKSTQSVDKHIQKREEQLLSNLCLSHKTGVALIALTGYLRFLLEDPTLTFQQ